MRPDQNQRIGYVLKMYPRFSETFIVSEMLAMQATEVDFEVFSLRLPTDGRFHETLAQLRAPVSYLDAQSLRAADLWTLLGRAGLEMGITQEDWTELLAVEVRDAAQAVELAQLVSRRGITHLHAHFASAATTVARLAARLAGVTYSFTAHAKDIFHHEVNKNLLRRKLIDAKTVIAISDFNKRYLTDTYGPAAKSVCRVYNGLDLNEFRFCSTLVTTKRIAAVGRLVEKKGFTDLLAAAAILHSRGLEFQLDIVGTGALAENLTEQRDRLGLTDQVTLHGALPQSEVRRIVSESCVFAAPCVIGDDGNRDGLPTVLLEAMALGTACVATPVTGIVEVIENGVTGLLVPEASPTALADALELLLTNGDLRNKLRHAARRRIEADFDARRQAAAVITAIFDERHPSPALAASESKVVAPMALVGAP